MSPYAGQILQSTSTDNNDYFSDTILLITTYNPGGAIGFIVNRIFGRKLNDLQEFAHLPGISLYEGGPMDQEHLYFIHRRPDVIEEGEKIAEGIWYGGNFTQATEAIASGYIGDNDIRIFIGYCGWDAGDLEGELAQDDWTATEYQLF